MNIWPVLPLVIPFIAGLVLLINRENPKFQKSISLLTHLTLLVVSFGLVHEVHTRGVLAFQMGNWPPPFGIFLAVDMLGAIMVALTSLVGFTALLFAFNDISSMRMRGSFYSLYFFLIFGMNGAFMTGDLFNLFVFYEVLLMTSYVLLILGNENRQAKDGFTYLTLNFIGSTLFLVGAGILYRELGTLNMAHLALRIQELENTGLVTIVAIIFFFVFGLKSAIFPIFNWLPDAYTAPPTSIQAVFAGLLTKVGVYSMYRAFGTIFSHDIGFTHTTLLVPLAGLTMLFGVWGAVVQYDVSKILAFHSISQVGYILMGLAIYAPLALAGGIFHMIHHSLIKSSLFLVGGGMERLGGSQDLKKLGGLVQISSFLGLLFMISAMALAGVPPLSGFFSKFTLVVSGLAEAHPLLVAAALVTSFFTLFSMIKIWRLGFWGVKKEDQTLSKRESLNNLKPVLLSCGLSVAFVILLTVLANPVMKISKSAGDQLLNKDEYIRAVLNTKPVNQKGRFPEVKSQEAHTS
jgi:multicomponent Na+:H+ antiporter subunit D